jgi:hypothetical protein
LNPPKKPFEVGVLSKTGGLFDDRDGQAVGKILAVGKMGQPGRVVVDGHGQGGRAVTVLAREMATVSMASCSWKAAWTRPVPASNSKIAAIVKYVALRPTPSPHRVNPKFQNPNHKQVPNFKQQQSAHHLQFTSSNQPIDDKAVKSRIFHLFVIPAQAGIQSFQ